MALKVQLLQTDEQRAPVDPLWVQLTTFVCAIVGIALIVTLVWLSLPLLEITSILNLDGITNVFSVLCTMGLLAAVAAGSGWQLWRRLQRARPRGPSAHVTAARGSSGSVRRITCSTNMSGDFFTIEVPIQGEYGKHTAKLDCTVRAWIEEGCLRDKAQIELSAPGISVMALGDNFFHALIHLREKLEPRWRVLCYGASLNVWPSGMSSQMSFGLRAYKREPGRPVSVHDLVDVFATGPDVIPATISEQREYIRICNQQHAV